MSQTLHHAEVSAAPSAVALLHSGTPTPHTGLFTNAALWMAQAFPTLLILVALGAIAFWGSQTGWKLPKFSSLAGKGEAEKNDWCDAHSVSESECVECNASLMPKEPKFGWCPTHGVQDCPWEHPELAQVRANSLVSRSDLERARHALDFAKRLENDAKCSTRRALTCGRSRRERWKRRLRQTAK
jgi:cobalt-zinc-cadmium efflux system membrane fusion protein